MRCGIFAPGDVPDIKKQTGIAFLHVSEGNFSKKLLFLSFKRLQNYLCRCILYELYDALA